MSKKSCEAAESIEDAIHDNRMFAERAFYCIANGAGELQPFLQLLSRKADSLQNHPFSFFRRMQRSSRFASALIFPSNKMARPFSFLVYTTS